MTCTTTHYSGCDCHEAQWNKQLTLLRDEVFQLRAQNAAYREALEKIANGETMCISSCYPECDAVAEEALKLYNGTQNQDVGANVKLKEDA